MVDLFLSELNKTLQNIWDSQGQDASIQMRALIQHEFYIQPFSTRTLSLPDNFRNAQC